MSIFELISMMPAWKEKGIELKSEEPFVTFQRGNTYIRMRIDEILIFGTKSIYKMFAVLDE